MFIQTEDTPNPQTIKFIPGKPVMREGVAEFLDRQQAAARSPLATRLFDVDGVASVFLGADFIAVTKNAACEWKDIKTYILGILFEHFSMNDSVVCDDVSSPDGQRRTLNDTERKICEILDTRIRPAVARDGGDVVFDRFEKGILWLHMRGACAGCPSSSMTLKMGIENMMRHMVPDVLEVRAVNG